MYWNHLCLWRHCSDTLDLQYTLTYTEALLVCVSWQKSCPVSSFLPCFAFVCSCQKCSCRPCGDLHSLWLHGAESMGNRERMPRTREQLVLGKLRMDARLTLPDLMGGPWQGLLWNRKGWLTSGTLRFSLGLVSELWVDSLEGHHSGERWCENWRCQTWTWWDWEEGFSWDRNQFGLVWYRLG